MAKFSFKRNVAKAAQGLVIGPSNMAGQATRWMQNVKANTACSNAVVFELERKDGVYWDNSQSTLISPESWSSRAHADQIRKLIRADFSHVLFEGGMPISGSAYGPSCLNDVEFFSSFGIKSAVVLHGSDIRVPSIHRELNGSSSPFDIRDEWSDALEVKSVRLKKLLASNPQLIRFISTTDLFDYVDGAVWLPVTVDLDKFKPSRVAFTDESIRVLHLPSKRRIKGSELVDVAMSDLSSDKRISYRSVEGLSQSQVLEQLEWADIVLDQFGVGGYGVFASEAMAMNRLVIGRLSSTVAQHQPDLPIVSTRPSDLPGIITEVVESRDAAKTLASKGREYTSKYHSGEMAARLLEEFMK